MWPILLVFVIWFVPFRNSTAISVQLHFKWLVPETRWGGVLMSCTAVVARPWTLAHLNNSGTGASGCDRPGRHCLHQARSTVRCRVSGMTGELHPIM